MGHPSVLPDEMGRCVLYCLTCFVVPQTTHSHTCVWLSGTLVVIALHNVLEGYICIYIYIHAKSEMDIHVYRKLMKCTKKLNQPKQCLAKKDNTMRYRKKRCSLVWIILHRLCVWCHVIEICTDDTALQWLWWIQLIWLPGIISGNGSLRDRVRAEM